MAGQDGPESQPHSTWRLPRLTRGFPQTLNPEPSWSVLNCARNNMCLRLRPSPSACDLN